MTFSVGRTPRVVPDRREQILDAAVEVFAAKGFDRATNRDIARAAGVTPGLIYHYFASKQELLRSAMERRSPLGLMRAIDATMFDLEPEPMLRALIGQMLAILESDRFVALMKVYLPEVIHDPTVAPLGVSVIGEATQALERYFARKMEQGVVRRSDPAFATHFLLGGIMDLVLRRQVLKDPAVTCFSRAEIVEGVVRMALEGLLPR